MGHSNSVNPQTLLGRHKLGLLRITLLFWLCNLRKIASQYAVILVQFWTAPSAFGCRMPCCAAPPISVQMNSYLAMNTATRQEQEKMPYIQLN